MDSAKAIFIGQAVENMTQSDGWKCLEQWLKERETQAINEIKKAQSFEEVIKLQAQLGMIDRINGRIKEWIANKNKELKNQVESR